MNIKDLDNWLAKDWTKYEALTKVVVSTMESLLKANNIDYLNINGRTKSKENILEKINRKGYKNPSRQLTDISGIRIITYFESDVDKICEIIKRSFRVDDKNSLDKKALLGIDRIGYRSIHFVCDLGDDRLKLPEFLPYKGLVFEFQLRTVLQHAWAELAHDRNYKFSGKLPVKIERKLYLYAGMLEIADQGFDELAREIDRYVDEINRETSSGNLNIEINSLSLDQFINDWARRNKFRLKSSPTKNDYADVIKELHCFGINNLEDLNNIISQDYMAVTKEIKYSATPIGLIRDFMIYADIKKYFKTCWDGSWGGLSKTDLKIFGSKYGKEDIKSIIDKYQIETFDD